MSNSQEVTMSTSPIAQAVRSGAAEAIAEFFAPTQRVVRWLAKALRRIRG